MKALLCSILLFSTLQAPLLAETAPATTNQQNQYSMVGTWSWKFFNRQIIFIFDNSGKINALSEKTYGSYKYYELPNGDYDILMRRIAGQAPPPDLPLKYKQQGNLLEVTTPDGNIQKNSLKFINNGRTVNLSREGESEILVSFEKSSDSTELPKNIEPKTTIEGNFLGLQKLVALQTAQSDYWIKKKRFATGLENLKVKPLPDSGQSYRYELVKQSPRQSIVAAISTQPHLRSFVLRLDRVGRRQQPFVGILCGTDRPSTQLPPLPQLTNNGLNCPSTTHTVDFNSSIRQSLLKVK